MADFPVAMFARSVDAAAAGFDPRANMLDVVPMEAGPSAGPSTSTVPSVVPLPAPLPPSIPPPLPAPMLEMQTSPVYMAAAEPRPNPLEQFLPRHTLDSLLKLWFDYVSWLIPYPHRPTFERDLAARREEGEGQEEWMAMVVALVMCTIVHIPKNNMPMPSEEATNLLHKTYSASLEFLGKPFVTYTSCRCKWVGLWKC